MISFFPLSFRLLLVWSTSSPLRWPGLPAKKQNLKTHVPSIQTQRLHRLVVQSSLIHLYIYYRLCIIVFVCMITLLPFCYFPQAPWMHTCSVESALVAQHDANWEYLLREITYFPATQNLSRDTIKNVPYSSGCIKWLLRICVVNLFVELVFIPIFILLTN